MTRRLVPLLFLSIIGSRAPAVETSSVIDTRPGIEFIGIAGGEFLMGSDQDDDARPVHRVRVGPFSISRYEVTHAQYGRFMADTGRPAPGHWSTPPFNGANAPVVGVTYADAAAFCKWAGGRLPTEAEWEFAARGTAGRPYPWGDAEPDPAHAIFHRDVASGTQPVGTAKQGATPEGVYDLAGSVAEWCGDWFDADYYRRSPGLDPNGPEKGEERVVRGGSWVSLPDACRATARAKYPPASRSTLIGIRVAR